MPKEKSVSGEVPTETSDFDTFPMDKPEPEPEPELAKPRIAREAVPDIVPGTVPVTPEALEPSKFDPTSHFIKVQGGKMYLPVPARVMWFRKEHPDWSIVTEPVEINLEKQYAIYRASILDTEGRVIATATKMENVKGFGDYLEKAETGSVGRALAYCGYGTQFAEDLDEGTNRIADAPSDPKQKYGGGYSSGGGNKYGNGGGSYGSGGYSKKY
jgi:uncharacterized membrane protein YgcG